VEAVPPYRRRDLATARASTRPTDDDYDRYVVLAAQYRDQGYADDLGGVVRFAVECPLFNAALAWSEDALADIAVRTGHDPSPHLRRAAALTEALVVDLWNDDVGAFVGYDVLAGRQLGTPSVAGLAPLLARRLASPIVERVVATAGAAYGLDGDGVQLPTTPPGTAGHDAARYWRGPAWANINWLVVQGLRIHDFAGHAAGLAERTLDLVRHAGMREYFHAEDGSGLGATGFGWTAAVTLDLLPTL
jgi:neutral trehalase